MHRPLSYRKLQNGTQGCANPNLSINHPPRIQFKCIVRAQNNAIFRAASTVCELVAGGRWRRRQKPTHAQAEGTHQARQKVVCELEAGGRLRSRQKAHTTQAEGTPRRGEKCHTLHTQHDTQLTARSRRSARTHTSRHTGTHSETATPATAHTIYR